MKKIVLFFFSLLAAGVVFADSFVLTNQVNNTVKNKKFRIAIQWAASAKEVEESNRSIKQRIKLDPRSLLVLTQEGKINLAIPKNMEYFRVLAWSNDGAQPDLLTNWVDIIPNKTYTLNENQLTPLALMSGMGC